MKKFVEKIQKNIIKIIQQNKNKDKLEQIKVGLLIEYIIFGPVYSEYYFFDDRMVKYIVDERNWQQNINNF